MAHSGFLSLDHLRRVGTRWPHELLYYGRKNKKVENYLNFAIAVPLGGERVSRWVCIWEAKKFALGVKTRVRCKLRANYLDGEGVWESNKKAQNVDLTAFWAYMELQRRSRNHPHGDSITCLLPLESSVTPAFLLFVKTAGANYIKKLFSNGTITEFNLAIFRSLHSLTS
jgi:hypothetical protein